jgi:hypothetical protein
MWILLKKVVVVVAVQMPLEQRHHIANQRLNL